MINWTRKDMLEINLAAPDDFLKVKETLTRMGIMSTDETKLYQSCHILHKLGHYYIMHFKELFALDGKSPMIENNDIYRRNTIAQLLSDWGLVELTNPIDGDKMVPVKEVKIISFKHKSSFDLIAKYTIGNK